MYDIKVNIINNSNKFRQSAISFESNGYYTPYPKGSKDYKNFWDEERKRCIHGYTSPDDDHITGYYYFYLNYTRIIISKEKTIIDSKGNTRNVKDRIESFPRFYDYDKVYFDAIEEAEHTGRHISIIKKRGAGYSFKGASMLCRNFYLIPHSKSYAIASEMEFLTRDGLLSKAWEMMTFVDNNTAWGKKRQAKDKDTHKRASFYSFKDGVKIESGYKSEIIGISLKNDIQKARGKRGKLILFEEAGKFPGLKDAWTIARPSVEDDDGYAFGLMVAYGTGGTEDGDYQGLRSLFYEPVAYNCLPIRNIWDEGAIDNECGFFVPQYYNMFGRDEHGSKFMDENGNSNIEVAKKYSLLKRQELLEKSNDKNQIDKYIAERPFTPLEATLQLSGNIFPKNDLKRHLVSIRSQSKIKNFKNVGELYFNDKGEVKFSNRTDLKDITSYVINHERDNKNGAVVIWEHPEDNPPNGLYIGGSDPYDHNKSTTNSLGSIFIYKRFQGFESYYDLPVAEYTGRPETADEFYEIVRMLGLYYNATILYENEKMGLFTYFSNKKCLHLLADQPTIIKDILPTSKVNRVKGIHMNNKIKNWLVRVIRDWLVEEYAPGHKNLTKIYSEPLLEELIFYNENGNFDRVIAFGLTLILNVQYHDYIVKSNEDIERSNNIFDGGVIFNRKTNSSRSKIEFRIFNI